MRSYSAVICVLLVASALAAKPRGLGGHGVKTSTKTGTTTTKKVAPSTKKPIAPTTTKVSTTAKPVKMVSTTAKPVKMVNTTAKPVNIVKKVKVTFTFAALNFTKLKPAVKTAMTKAVTDSVLEGLGAGYTKDHVSVELKSGSIIAVVSITPKEGATAAALSTSMNTTARGAIEKTMAKKVKAVPAIKDVVADGKTLDDIAAVSAAPVVVQVAVPITAKATTAAPKGNATTAPATTKALRSTGASAPIAAVSMSTMLLLAASQNFA